MLDESLGGPGGAGDNGGGPDETDAALEPERHEREPSTRRRRGSAGGTVLGAAMLAVGEILEPEKSAVEIVQTDDDRPDDDDLPFEIDFGTLPPLD